MQQNTQSDILIRLQKHQHQSLLSFCFNIAISAAGAAAVDIVSSRLGTGTPRRYLNAPPSPSLPPNRSLARHSSCPPSTGTHSSPWVETQPYSSHASWRTNTVKAIAIPSNFFFHIQLKSTNNKINYSYSYLLQCFQKSNQQRRVN